MNTKQDKVICLGKEFATEAERREYYRNELRIKLHELKKIDGFPIGEDEDIIALSDPPYYTACPNPWINDFIAEWEKEKESIENRNPNFHVAEPYASDVSEGKNNTIFNAHSYHTKVPHPAIMRYILQYTQPGDIVFDGFAGTGMTGVAAQMCNQPEDDIKIKIESEFSHQGTQIKWGLRKAIISDLAPIATFIGSQYNKRIDKNIFGDDFYRVYNDAIEKIGWLYETKHTSGSKGKINYTVWSEVFTCPNCNSEIIFYEVGLDVEKGKIFEKFHCPSCKSELKKADLNRSQQTIYDTVQKKTITQNKYIPIIINYSVGTKRFEKKPDALDLEKIDKAKELLSNFSAKHIGSYPMMLVGGENWGDIYRSGYHQGITHSHHFYTERNLLVIATLWNNFEDTHLKWAITAILNYVNKKQSYTGGGGGMPGVFYVASLVQEKNVFDVLKRKVDNIVSVFEGYSPRLGGTVVSTESATGITNIASNSIDYIFTDPPFSSNIMYSEGSFLWESWLGIFTNNKQEAIENKSQDKTLTDYINLMAKSFAEFYRVLKPGKWITVEFSNTSAAVWNGIQTALQKAGFIIANVAALDKKQGGFKGVTTPTAVQQDLVISCYKSSTEFDDKFKIEYDQVAIWDFVNEHLHHLPVHMRKDNNTTTIIERSPKILFDRLITFYLMRDLKIPIDAVDFQKGIKERFSERDGMYFTAEQVAEYDEKKAITPTVTQQELFVGGESDAIEWLKEKLRKIPQKYQDIMPDFRKAPQSIRKGDEIPELLVLLEQNFIQDVDSKWRTPNPNEAADREALRNKALIKEFNTYVTAITKPKAKKLKEVRVEALRAGFKNCWEQKNFKTIVTLGDMIPQNILLEDEQLLMYYDIAKDRV